MEDKQQQIQNLISSINFKDSNINFDLLKEQIASIVGSTPSVMPKWSKEETANEDKLLNGSNKTVEKISELNIVYLGENNIPVNLKFII